MRHDADRESDLSVDRELAREVELEILVFEVSR